MKKHWDNPIEHPMPEQTRVPASVQIGGVTVAPATVLAPMAGVTDTVFRRFIRNSSMFMTSNAWDTGELVREAPPSVRPALRNVSVFSAAPDHASVDDSVTNQQSGCGLIMTEFTSADGLSRMRESKRRRYLTFYDDEHPIAAQLFGSNPATLAEAARIVEETGFDMVDLNLGCPSKRVVTCNGGSGLLRDLPLIGEIFKAVRAAVRIPFTVKFRLGWNDNHIVCVPLARLAEDSGLNAVSLHARTREQGYAGQARWEHIAEVKAAVRIPVIGNGDVRTPEDACALIAKTGCDAVMIGRAAPANPWIFRQIAQYTATGRYDLPTDQDRYRMIRTYFAMLLAELTPDTSRSPAAEAAGKMKQFASWFTHGVPGGAALRKSIYEARNGAAILDAVDRFFELASEQRVPQICPGLADVGEHEPHPEQRVPHPYRASDRMGSDDPIPALTTCD
ncbi:MAG TPA: tRNA-dihydrouridine synthase [Acidobacteriaceae bacterium]|jgi:nifR3 family TIM-barrel protein|nr:tRNA-dihydrouridine synthase [Acidobacteriaceae bacterium]